MPRPSCLSALLLAGLALTTAACSRDSNAPAADAPTASPSTAQDWSALRDFTAIDATGPDNVSVTIGAAFTVRAEGDARTLADLAISVKGDRLVIGRKSQGRLTWGRKDGATGATIFVTMPAIAAATLTGAGDFTLDRAEGDALALALTGAGDFRIGQVRLSRLTTDITGAGSIKLSGTADSATLSITGVGDIDGTALRVGTADIEITGAGDIDIASDGKVAITLMGPGDVTVKGKAQCTINGMGPGEARCAP